MTAIDKYLNIPTSQHKTKPNFTAWLTTALNVVNDNMSLNNSMPASFDIDSAVGVQLDILGVYIGRSRTLNYQPSGGVSPVLDDVHYRLALKAKIAQNQWDGTVPQMYAIWNSLFPAVSLFIVDNQNMTISAVITGQLDSVSTEMVANGKIIPKPSGVKLSIITSTTITDNVSVGLAMSGLDVISLSVPPDKSTSKSTALTFSEQ